PVFLVLFKQIVATNRTRSARRLLQRHLVQVESSDLFLETVLDLPLQNSVSASYVGDSFCAPDFVPHQPAQHLESPLDPEVLERRQWIVLVAHPDRRRRGNIPNPGETRVHGSGILTSVGDCNPASE